MQPWAPPPVPLSISLPTHAHSDIVYYRYYQQSPFDYQQWASLGYAWPYFRGRFDPNNRASPLLNFARQPQNYEAHAYPPQDGGYDQPPEQWAYYPPQDHWAYYQPPQRWAYHQPADQWPFPPPPERAGFQQALEDAGFQQPPEHVGYQDQAIHGAHLDGPEPGFHLHGAYQPDFESDESSNRNASGSWNFARSNNQFFPPDFNGSAELMDIEIAGDVFWPPVAPTSFALVLICTIAAVMGAALSCDFLFQQVINPLAKPSPNFATQVSRDENPDKFVLSIEERLSFRREFPLSDQFLLPLRPTEVDDPRHTLVLDLDETLIHTSFESPAVPNDDDVLKFQVSLRPFVKHFLREVAQCYEIVIYTASLPTYADKILNGLDPDNTIFKHRLYRHNCSFFKGVYVKDLEMLGRPLEKVVFMDNYPGAYMMQPANALPITSFVGGIEDSELFLKMKILRLLKSKDDVRPLLKRYQHHWKRLHFSLGQEDDTKDEN